jgi:hypothetical protein
MKMLFPQTGFARFHLLNFIFNLMKFEKFTVNFCYNRKFLRLLRNISLL